MGVWDDPVGHIRELEAENAVLREVLRRIAAAVEEGDVMTAANVNDGLEGASVCRPR